MLGIAPIGYETVIELGYQAQVLPWLQVQPDLQYFITPAAAYLTQIGRATASAVPPYSAYEPSLHSDPKLERYVSALT